MEAQKPANQTYSKTAGFANMTGELYEVKMSALLFLRALNKGINFQLASNMKAAGCFDDVVLILENVTIFLQLKHKESSNFEIKLSQLAHHKDFNLPKYLNSYLDLKQQWEQNNDFKLCGKLEDAIFIIYTNARVTDSLVSNVSDNELLNTVNTGGKFVSFTKLFENLPKYKHILYEALNIPNSMPTPEVIQTAHKLYNIPITNPSEKQLNKLLNDLTSLEDLSYHQEFLSQLYFCTEQVTEKELDHFIRHELQTVCGTDTVFNKYMSEIQTWWRNSNNYISPESQFWQDILQSCAANIAQHKNNQILALDITFKNEECHNMKEKLTTSGKITHIETQCTNITCLKVLQSLKTSLVVDTSTLQSNLNEVLAVWKLGTWGDILIIEEGRIDMSIYSLFSSVFQLSPTKKLVIITAETYDIPEVYQEFQCNVITDTFTLNQLDLDSQTRVLECKVNFQGMPASLWSLADLQTLQCALTSDVVIQLLNGQQLTVGCKLDELDKCYIYRTLFRRECIKKEILSHDKDDRLAISGMSKEELQQIVPSNKAVVKYNKKICSDKNHYFLIKDALDFAATCEVYSNIHWIHNSADGLMWKHSKEDITFIKGYLEHIKITYRNIQETMKSPQKILLIIAEPGMGKSTEMLYLASAIKGEDPTTWIVTVDLKNHTKYLSQEDYSATELLIHAGQFKTEFEKMLLKYQLYRGGKVCIMLDGFDEISPNYSKKVISMIKHLADTMVLKILVTSRPEFQEKLEQELCTLPFVFNPFTICDQKNFLLKYWEAEKSKYDLRDFIARLLKLTERSLEDRLREFTGIPLQMKMLAEIFANEASHYKETGEIMLPPKLDILQLYNKFIDLKWEVYFGKMCLNISKVGLSTDYYDLRYSFEQAHMNCAAVSLLESDKINKLPDSAYVIQNCQEFITKFKRGHSKTGIVTNIVNDKPIFIHRTFGELFLAKFLSQFFVSQIDKNSFLNKCYNIALKFFGNGTVGMKEFYRDEILFNFPVVRKFFDRILANKFDLHVAVLNQNSKLVEELVSDQNIDVNMKDEAGRTALHMAVINFLDITIPNYDGYIPSHYYQNDNDALESKNAEQIVFLLLTHGADSQIKDRVLKWTPLRLADEIKAWPAVELMLQKGGMTRDLIHIKRNIHNKFFLTNILHEAAKRGFVNLVEYMLNCGVRVDHRIIVKKYFHANMLHVAAEHGQLRMAKFLVRHKADINACWNDNLRTPLMCAAEYGEVQMTEFLLQQGADIEFRNVMNQNALFTAATKDHHKVIVTLHKYGADMLARHWRGNTVMHRVAERGAVNCVSLLLDMKLDPNITNNLLETPIMSAASQGHYRVIQMLSERGANFAACDLHDNTILHHSARSHNVKCMSLLLKMGLNIYINSRNSRSQTPLMQASQYGMHDNIDLLLQHGAEITAQDKQCNTALHYAVNCAYEQCTTLLLDRGIKVDSKNVDGETSLMWAIRTRNIEILQLLLSHGADLNKCNKKGQTALHKAARFGYLNVVELLVQNGARVTACDNDGNTPLDLAKLSNTYFSTEEISAVIDLLSNIQLC